MRRSTAESLPRTSPWRAEARGGGQTPPRPFPPPLATPFDYFLASLGTCAGIYVLSFCRHRQIATEGLALKQRMEFTSTDEGKKRLAKVIIEIDLPPGFPEKYRNAIVKAAELCAVKKAIMDPPEFVITAHSS
jgi:putative redox protein